MPLQLSSRSGIIVIVRRITSAPVSASRLKEGGDAFYVAVEAPAACVLPPNRAVGLRSFTRGLTPRAGARVCPDLAT